MKSVLHRLLEARCVFEPLFTPPPRVATCSLTCPLLAPSPPDLTCPFLAVLLEHLSNRPPAPNPGLKLCLQGNLNEDAVNSKTFKDTVTAESAEAQCIGPIRPGVPFPL